MQTSSKHTGPDHLPVTWCHVPLFSPSGLVIISVIRLLVINNDYIVYFTIYHFMCET
jgi:hypothetical protein